MAHLDLVHWETCGCLRHLGSHNLLSLDCIYKFLQSLQLTSQQMPCQWSSELWGLDLVHHPTTTTSQWECMQVSIASITSISRSRSDKLPFRCHYVAEVLLASMLFKTTSCVTSHYNVEVFSYWAVPQLTNSRKKPWPFVSEGILYYIHIYEMYTALVKMQGCHFFKHEMSIFVASAYYECLCWLCRGCLKCKLSKLQWLSQNPICRANELTHCSVQYINSQVSLMFAFQLFCRDLVVRCSES